MRTLKRAFTRYLWVNLFSVILAVAFICVYSEPFNLAWFDKIGWGIGIFLMSWCAYMDMRVQCVPTNYLIGLLLAPGISAFLHCLDMNGQILPIICCITNTLSGMCIAAGAIWMFRTIMSFVFQKEALGEGDIFPCAMVGGFLGGFIGVCVYFLSPFAMIPVFVYILSKGKSIRKSPLIPGLLLVTLFILPISTWITSYISRIF